MSLPAKPIDVDLLKTLATYCEILGLRWRNPKSHSRRRKIVIGGKNQNGYFHAKIGGKNYKLHRLVWAFFHGDPGPTAEIDHVDGDKTNNKIENLRVATRTENNTNAKLRSDNTSGVKGVSWYKRSGKWRATIQKHKKKIFLGDYDSIEDAQNAVIAARLNAHGKFANHGTSDVIKHRTGRMAEDGTFIKDA